MLHRPSFMELHNRLLNKNLMAQMHSKSVAILHRPYWIRHVLQIQTLPQLEMGVLHSRNMLLIWLKLLNLVRVPIRIIIFMLLKLSNLLLQNGLMYMLIKLIIIMVGKLEISKFSRLCLLLTNGWRVKNGRKTAKYRKKCNYFIKIKKAK